MASANRYFELALRMAWIAPLGAAAICAVLWFDYCRLPADVAFDRATVPERTAALAWPISAALPGEREWGVFEKRVEHNVVQAGALAKRFRLAGTFTVSGVGPEPVRKAVLDDTRMSSQRIVAENDPIDDITVVRIFRDHVVLRDPTGEETLWISSAQQAGPEDVAGGGTNATETAEAEAGLNAFGGRRVGEHRWMFSRQALLDYYQELRDEPERLVRVFDSLEPLYGAQHRIEGYRLNVRGEAGFFSSVGLEQDDVVRRVNQMEMTSRNRAEYFISEFVQNRANAFVIDVEREGKPLKLIYQVR